MTANTYTGTASEQWALAGIDLALGRITAEELHELGARLFAERYAEDSDEVKRLKREIYGLEDELYQARKEADEAEDQVRELKERIKKLEASGK